jgi:plasmid maintenance system antidote protein VapI
MTDRKSQPRSQPASEGAVLTKALLKAAANLDLPGKTLAAVIGVSEATVSRMRAGEHALEPGQKAFELAVLFVRLYRSLDAIVGGEDRIANAWLRNRNVALDAVPVELIKSIAGLTNVIAYLDARRAIV